MDYLLNLGSEGRRLEAEKEKRRGDTGVESQSNLQWKNRARAYRGLGILGRKASWFCVYMSVLQEKGQKETLY